MNQGLYEELVTKLINYKINELDKDTFQVKKTLIDKAEAAQLLSQHIGKTIKHAFTLIKGDDVVETQIEIANKIILFLLVSISVIPPTFSVISDEEFLLLLLIIL